MKVQETVAEIRTDGPRPSLIVDGEPVPIAGVSYEETVDGFVHWHFTAIVEPAARAGCAEILDHIDPEWLEGQALAIVDAFEGRPAPVMSAVLHVLRQVVDGRA